MSVLWELTPGSKDSHAARVLYACPYTSISLPRPLTRWLELRAHETGSEATKSQWNGYLCLGKT